MCRDKTRLAALIRFGRENDLCFGIEFSDERLRQKTVIQVPRTTVREAVKAILAADKGDTLMISARNGVVLIRSRRSPSPDWLDHRLSQFRIHRMQLVLAGLNLAMALESDLRPSVKGFAGDFPAGDPADEVGPLDIRGATIRELLCSIVGVSRKADWIVTMGLLPESGKSGSINPYWTLLYDSLRVSKSR